MFKLLLINAILSCVLLSSVARAGMNKWVDENGQIHYGDSVPSKYRAQEHSELSPQGITVRTTHARKTGDELDEEKKQNKLRLKLERERLIVERKKALRDRVLLDTFTTERDLEIARDARIEALDSQISLAETLIKHDLKKLEGIKKRIKSIRDSGREPPENLLKSEKSVSRQLENNYEYVEDKGNERTEILQTFEADVKRFRVLKKAKRDKAARRVE